MQAIKPQAVRSRVQTGEAVLREHGQWLHFAGAHRFVQAQAREEVLPALREVEAAVEAHGWHAAGLISYEAAPVFDAALRVGAHPESDFPLLWFGLYPEPRSITLPEPVGSHGVLAWHPEIEQDTYLAAIDRIHADIADGRTYQVNYTLRLRSAFEADPWDFFLQLARTQNQHAAYLDLGQYVIASASPELFFQLDGRKLTGRPMKGTAPRGRTTPEDQAQARWLQSSEKNRAENVMIVDMLRNDLGRIAQIGSVQVPELFTVERYPTLWQMTSTVTAHTDASLAQIVAALFPCASITGAPKASTMGIIAELEHSPRRIYTGSLGHLAPGRRATFNVAIRTALIDRRAQTAEYGVGGGIVWDSTGPEEYVEALLKARVLTESRPEFSLLETLLWTPEAGYFLRDRHLARLLDSADYFDFLPISHPERSAAETKSERSEGATKRQTNGERPEIVTRQALERALDELAQGFTSPQRVRLLLDRNGRIETQSTSFEPPDRPLRARLAQTPVDARDVFLFHKTTQREVYDRARQAAPDCDEVLLFNENGELTEFTLGNLVVELDGRLYTPPVSCGLLAGTFRASLLEAGQVEERVLLAAELPSFQRIFLVNSVRKWVEVNLLP